MTIKKYFNNDNKIKIVHIEAGLRSFDERMPEEINRIACDHMSSLLFSPTKQGILNLKNEGFSKNKDGKASMDKPHMYHCGDIMLDNSMFFSQLKDDSSKVMDKLNLEKNNYVLCTIHRDSNTDKEANL